MQGIFVTGTDTEVGKTFVCIQLIKILIDEGLKVSVMKPVASGATYINGHLENEDAFALMEAANISSEYHVVNPYVFAPAIAPHLAAQQAGIEIDFLKIKENYEILNKHSDVVIVEGAGGWFAPLSMQTTIADLAKALALPVVIVVGLRLGCLNHTLLTVQAIQKAGVAVAGWIANHVEVDFPCAEDNIATLKKFLADIPYLGTVPYQTAAQQNKIDLDVSFISKYL